MNSNDLQGIYTRQVQCGRLLPQLGGGAILTKLIQDDVTQLLSTVKSTNEQLRVVQATYATLVNENLWLQQENLRLRKAVTFEDKEYDVPSLVTLLREEKVKAVSA